MSSRLFALSALVVLTLSGCLGVPDGGRLDDPAAAPGSPEAIAAMLTQPVYEVTLHERLSLRSFDDTHLAIELYRPETPPEVKVPVILVMTPYMEREDLTDSPYDSLVTDYFVPRGYAVAFGAVRGTYNSGGCLPQTDRDQARDGYEMVEFLAAQPWSSGKVGMFGVSYDAETQQSTATFAPPHLVTIVPIASISNQYLWLFQNGVPYETGWLGMTGYAVDGLAPGHTPEALAAYPEKVPCHVETHRNAMAPWHDGRMNDFWDQRNWQPLVKNITASVFYIQGLQDPTVQPIHLLGWYNEIPSPKKAWIGQWRHAYPTREDFTFTLHRWFDHWLVGIDTGLMQEPAVQIQDSLGRWRNDTAYPPESTPWTLYPRREAFDNRRLSHEAPFTDEPEDSWADARTAPFRAMLPAPAGQAPPRVTFTTEVLQEAVHVSGPAQLDLWVQVSAGSTHLAAHLYDVGPDGVARLVTRGYMDTEFREGLYEPKAMGPDEVALLSFVTQPADAVFQPGHRIALAVMSLDDEIEQDDAGSTVRLHHDAEHPSRVTLPVVHPAPGSFHLMPEAPEAPLRDR